MDVSKCRGHPLQEGVIAGKLSSSMLSFVILIMDTIAYDKTMKAMVIVATLISVVPIILSLGMPDW